MGALYEGATPQAIDAAVDALSGSGVVLMPADTVYGFFGMAAAQEAVERVYGIKQRDRGKPFVLYTDARSVDRWAEVGPVAKELVDTFWPEALALVLPRRDTIPAWFTAGGPTVAVMTAANHLISSVVSLVDGPVFGTTVNYSGEPSITTGADAMRFRDRVDVMIVDDSIPVYNVSSTILDCTIDPPVVIREEAIPLERIHQRIPGVRVDRSRRK